ncbi:MAG: sce7726 family protein [Acidobacteriaceae bacterium]|nr:sce7726 family protein [Acidobacteriaceae bacterium]
MRDRDVRERLYRQVRAIYAQEPDTRFISELVLNRGAARIDLAVINGRLHGYEIKSDADTLDRLSTQIEAYDSVFDEITIVVGVRHLARAEDLIPRWWGIMRAESYAGGVELSVLRNPETNPRQSGRAVAELLWRDEAMALLRRYSITKGLAKLNRTLLAEKIDELLDRSIVFAFTREALKARVGWRVDEQQTLCDGLFPPVARL